MRALHPTTTPTLRNSSISNNKFSQHNPSAADSRSSEDDTNRPRNALKPPTTTPRPISRQSTLSSYSSTSGQSNTDTNPNHKTGIERRSESVSCKTPKPPVILKTVTKTSRGVPSTATHSSNRIAPSTTRTITSTRSSTAPAKPPSSRPPSVLATTRPPLRARDQNATLVTRQSLSMSKSVRVMMPYDRSSNPNGAKSQSPHLGTGAARVMGRTPMTPKIATKTAQSPALATITHTPLAKRAPRPTTADSATSVPAKSSLHQEDELPSFFVHNITPRTGKRQSRVDSANSTPNGTPNPERTEGWDRDVRSGLGISPPVHHSETTRPAVHFSPIPSLNEPHRRDTQNDADSKFFHASDAKSVPQPPPPKPALTRAPTFFYANGNTVEDKPSPYTPHAPAQAQISSQDSMSSKFVYANGTPDLRPSPPAIISRPGSVVSVASKAPTSRPGTSSHGNGHPAAHQRPGSPIKLAQHPQPAPPRNHNLPPITTGRSHIVSSPQLGPPAGLRRTSTGTSRGSHSRNGSLVLGEADLKFSHVSSGPSSPSIASASQPPPLTLASIIQAAEDLSDDEDATSPDDSRSELHSPTKSTHSADPISELVANARRERKVQDLQITNASLEAINRTIERQLRKQTAELRRYRRLSRSGRLSMASTTASSPKVSDASSLGEEVEGLVLADLSEEDSDFEPEEDSFSDTDSASDSLSPSLIAERDARHRKHDEKRLQLDLSKHQELLSDSHRMNQSIKRCLDWTEELIKEGKKALEYQVRVSDVVIPGPRVLNPVDEDDELTQTSISFDPDTTFEDKSLLEEKFDLEDIPTPLPRLAGWKPEPNPLDGDIEMGLSVEGG